jgi:hypothetical protein
LKPARQIVPETLSRKNPSQKSAGAVAQGVDPVFKSQYDKKKKKKKKKQNAGEIQNFSGLMNVFHWVRSL